MNPTTMAEKPMFPTHQSNPSDGEPDAVKVARPVRRGGWRKPAGAVRPSAVPSLPNVFEIVTRGRRCNMEEGVQPCVKET